jgi:hypothetical protein
MPTITSAASGNWSAPATWVGGVAPTSVDGAVIANTHTVTMDTTGLVALSVVVQSGGVLNASTTANSDLTTQNIITVQANGTMNVDLSAFPAITHEQILNAGLGNGTLSMVGDADASTISFKGAPRTRWTRLNGAIAIGAVSATMVNVTGWRVGDNIVLGTTATLTEFPTTASDRYEERVITSIVGLVVGWAAATLYAYKDTGYVGNTSSNVIIRSYTAGQTVGARLQINIQQEDVTKIKLFSHVQFSGLSGDFYGAIFIYTAFWQSDSFRGFLDCAFYDTFGLAVNVRAGHLTLPIERCVFFTKKVHSIDSYNNHLGISGSVKESTINNNLFLKTTYAALTAFNGGDSNAGYVEYVDNHFIGVPMGNLSGAFIIHTRATTSGNVGAINLFGEMRNCKLRTIFGEVANTGALFDIRGMTDMRLRDCEFIPGTILSGYWVSSLSVIGAPDAARLTVINQNSDPLIQEIYTNESSSVPRFARENTEKNRSLSSVKISPGKLNSSRNYTFSIPTANGKTSRIIGFIKANTAFYNAGVWTPPTVTISGLGITPVIFTASAAANNAWEKFDISATNSSGSDGNLTVTYDARASTVTTGDIFISGVPDGSPFVTRARHYGFLMEQTTPDVQTNDTTSAAEATAAAYTGMAVTWGASLSTTAISADRTFQQLYDYTQAQACLNIESALPLTGVGVAGSPSLFASGALTTTGFTLNGSGSISMGAFVLTGSLPWVYTYTGGSFSQATTVPSFNGGQLNIGAGGTYNFVTAGSTIISMTPAASSTYNLAGSTFTGTADLRNTSAFAITVHIPTGTGYITTNNTGGAITVSAPAVYQSVTVNGLVANSRIRIYDTIAAVELYNGIVAGTSYTWTDTVAAAANRTIGLRASNVQNPSSVPTAYIFIDTAIGTCGTTTATAAVSYLASQAIDSNYNANGIDGAVITDCSIVTTALHVDITSGSATIQHIYAFMVYWLYTAIGIADQTTEMTSRNTADYVVNSGFTIKNTSSPSVPLLVTGGNVSMSSGSDIALLDTTGGSIYMKSATVVPYSAGASATIAIVQQGLDANGYTTSRAPKIDNLDAAVSILPTEVWGKAIEGMTAEQILRVTLAALAGKRAGLGTATENYMAQDGITPRITFAETDAFGNGTPTLNGGVP